MRTLWCLIWALTFTSCSGGGVRGNPWPPPVPRQPERLELISPAEPDQLVWWQQNVFLGLANKGAQDVRQQEFVQTIFEQTNVAREANGIAPVQMLDSLNAVAQAHAMDLATRDYWAHRTPEGLSSRQRVLAATGLVVVTGGENTFYGFSGTESAEYTVRSWEFHTGHRDLLLNPGVQYMGAGLSQFSSGGPLFVTQLLVSFDGM